MVLCILCFLSHYFPVLFLITPLRYHSLLDRAEERRRRLLQRYNEFLLAYEAGDMLEWIQEKKTENTGVELDDVWELQKKFDEFQRVREGTLLNVILEVFILDLSNIFPCFKTLIVNIPMAVNNWEAVTSETSQLNFSSPAPTLQNLLGSAVTTKIL